MKLSFPLWLKVSLWLVLNLVLLAVVGVTFLVKESGFTWDALVTGPAGNRLQAVADVITAELRESPPAVRDVTLARFSQAYGVTFFLFQNNSRQLGGPPLLPSGLPEAVRQRFMPPNGGGPRGNGGPGGGPGGRGGVGGRGGGGLGAPPGAGGRGQAPPGESPAGAVPAGARPSTGPVQTFVGQPGRPPDNNPLRGRFLVRTAVPPAYWAGVRLLPIPDDFGGGVPATLLMRADSLGATALLLDLDPWLWAAGVAVGLSVVFWLPLVRSITRSLRELTFATEQIAEGRFDTRVDETRRDELGRLGGAVNQMAEQLDRAATGQKRFLGDIAHELGSPVGRLQVAVSILEEQAAPALQPAVADVREEVQQMSALVGELLAFTKAGLRARDVALARVELAPLVAGVLAREAAEGKVFVRIPPRPRRRGRRGAARPRARQSRS